MKVITEPTVHVVGRSTMDEKKLDDFLGRHDVHGWETDTECGGEYLAEVAGRTCYMSFAKPRPGGNATYLGHIKESGHGSVLEHPTWNMIFTGVSRTLTHELVRHRAGWAYSQLSQRYVDESVCEVVVPKELQDEVSAAQKFLAERAEQQINPTQKFKDFAILGQTNMAIEKVSDHVWDAPYQVLIGLLWLNSMAQTSDLYQIFTKYLSEKVSQKRFEESKHDKSHAFDFGTWKELLTAETKTTIRKDARQAARSVLPNATETKIFVTANARAIRHFIEMRGSKFAEPEIRMLAYKVWRMLISEAFNLFGDYEWTTRDSFPLNVTTKFRKV